MKNKLKDLSFDELTAVLLPILAAIVTALFWTVWYLIYGEVPYTDHVYSVISIYDHFPTISRWWDIIFVAFWVGIFCLMNIHENINTEDSGASNFSFWVGIVFGFLPLSCFESLLFFLIIPILIAIAIQFKSMIEKRILGTIVVTSWSFGYNFILILMNPLHGSLNSLALVAIVTGVATVLIWIGFILEFLLNKIYPAR